MLKLIMLTASEHTFATRPAIASKKKSAGYNEGGEICLSVDEETGWNKSCTRAHA